MPLLHYLIQNIPTNSAHEARILSFDKALGKLLLKIAEQISQVLWLELTVEVLGH